MFLELVELKFEFGDLAADALGGLLVELVDLVVDLLVLSLILLLFEVRLPSVGSCYWINMSVKGKPEE